MSVDSLLGCHFLNIEIVLTIYTYKASKFCRNIHFLLFLQGILSTEYNDQSHIFKLRTKLNHFNSREIVAANMFLSKKTFLYTDKKENKIFLIYKEMQSGSFAKSYRRKGFLIYEKMHNFLTI